MSAEPKTITHWADGKAFAGESGRWGEVTNPATGQVSGRVALASTQDAALQAIANDTKRPLAIRLKALDSAKSVKLAGETI